MVNKVLLIGRLGHDPELKYTATGLAICNLRIATDESYVDRDGNKVERTEWHTIVVFQRQALSCSNFLLKGSLIYVEGSLQTRKWQDQQGQDKYSTEIKAQRVQFLDNRTKHGEQEKHSSAQNENDRQFDQGANQSLAFPLGSNGMDDVPF